MWANIRSLNALRGAKLLNQLSTTSTALLDSRNHDKAAMFMIADTIHHGDIVLRSHPVLTYLAYLIQMGVVMSPLSTNQMAFSYEENPFGKYFKRGLRVTLATDSPLQLHLTNEPLSEEYAIAGQMLKLSDCDLSEIARTSVVISSIPEQTKVKLIGDYAVDGPHCVGSLPACFLSQNDIDSAVIFSMVLDNRWSQNQRTAYPCALQILNVGRREAIYPARCFCSSKFLFVSDTIILRAKCSLCNVIIIIIK
jgi:hypothetical protein